MLNSDQIQYLSDYLRNRYDEKELASQHILAILITLQIAKKISSTTLRSIAESIIRDEEMEAALIEANSHLKSKDQTYKEIIAKAIEIANWQMPKEG